MLDRLVTHWAQGTGLAGLLLLALTPVLSTHWPGWLVATWLCLPVYMLHQFEEHDGGRFGAFVNELFGDGREILGPQAIFLINVPLVWGIAGASFGLATLGHTDAGLLGLYLVFLNGLLHIAQAVALGRSNPGLWTAIVLFVPLGLYGLMNVPADTGAHLSAALLIVILHLMIVLHLRARITGGVAHGA